jgi:hypothetical protein
MTRELCKLAIEQFERVRTIGEIQVYLPEPHRWNTIANHNLPAEKQFFPYPEVPKVITEEFLHREAERLNGGFWFFNGGRLEYISDTHYLLLAYWKDKGKSMLFIDAQRDVLLHWQQVEKMPNMAGVNLATNRRFGKTTVGNCILYKRTTSGPFRRGGMQSKTNEDVKTIFKKLISSWTQLPDFLKPVDSGESRPATILEFSEPRKRASKDTEKIYGEALNSSIDHRSSVEEAYDGEELYTMYDDENGKTKEVNTDTRYYIYRFCLQKGASITGKTFRTTTVEDMEKKGGANFKKTWDASRISTTNPKTGRTESYLTNLFIPADYGYLGAHPVTGVEFVDKHGYSNREAAREFILSLWENLEGDDLSKAQQKDPLSEKHMWQAKNFGGCFRNDLLQIQLDYLERTNSREDDNAPPNLVTRVTFYRDESGVKFRHDKDGDCQMVWDFNNPPAESNKNGIGRGGLRAPGNTDGFAIGVDPIGATTTTGSENSQAVAYVYRKGDLNDPENSGLVVLRYAPVRKSIKRKRDFHMYIMMLCEYYGCKANYESDIDDYYETFEQEGFVNYVMMRPKNTIDPNRKRAVYKYGTPSKDPYALHRQHDIAYDYIVILYHKIYFVELVRKLINFDPDNRTEFDDCIAFFMALIGGTDRKQEIKPKTSALAILPVFNKTGVSLAFKNTG